MGLEYEMKVFFSLKNSASVHLRTTATEQEFVIIKSSEMYPVVNASQLDRVL